jgi:hypothetical protein
MEDRPSYFHPGYRVMPIVMLPVADYIQFNRANISMPGARTGGDIRHSIN